MWLKDTNQLVTMCKFAIELKKYCKIKKYNNVEVKQKKINKKNINVWIGISQSYDDVSDSEDLF